MRTVLILLALAVVVVGLGYSLGWFRFSTGHDNGRSNVTVSVDNDKIEADKDKVEDKMQDLGQKAADKIGATTPQVQD